MQDCLYELRSVFTCLRLHLRHVAGDAQGLGGYHSVQLPLSIHRHRTL